MAEKLRKKIQLVVLKHLRGQHDQKWHGNRGAPRREISDLPYVKLSDVKPEDYKSYKKVMNFETDELRRTLQEQGLTKSQALGMINEARAFSVSQKQTLEKHTINGMLSPEREKLYDEYVDSLFSENVIPKSIPPRFFLTGGLPGSGKSTMMGQEIYKGIEDNFVMVDADKIRIFLAQKDGIKNIGKHSASYQDETDVVLQKVFNKAVSLKANLVLDATMKTGNKIRKFVDMFRNFGYKTEIAFADLPLEIAMSRAVSRFLRGGRFVDPAMVLSHDGKNRASVDYLKDFVDTTRIWSTDVPRGQNPILVEAVGD